MKKKILLIETSDIGAKPTGEAVRHLGFEPVFLVNLKNYQADTLSQILQYEHYDTDTTSVDSMQAWIEKQNWDVFAVTTFLDSRLHLAIDLASRLQVRGLDPRLLPFKDKGRVEELAPGICPPSISFSRDFIPLDDIASFRERFSNTILKPRCTAGGLGFRMFTAQDKLPEILSHLRNFNIPHHLQPTEWMIQAFIPGELVSVEGFVKAGEINILGLTGRRKIGNTESWFGFPYEHKISERAANQAHAKVRELLQLSGLKYAFFHIEVIVNATEAYVIDANLGRMGGAGLGEILATAYKVHPIEIFAEVLRISLDLDGAAEFWKRVPQPAISIAYGVQNSCFLHSFSKAASPSIYHTQILSEGKVPAMGTDNWAWVGIVSGVQQEVHAFLDQVYITSLQGVQGASYALPKEAF